MLKEAYTGFKKNVLRRTEKAASIKYSKVQVHIMQISPTFARRLVAGLHVRWQVLHERKKQFLRV
jgi:hypothetical protein